MFEEFAKLLPAARLLTPRSHDLHRFSHDESAALPVNPALVVLPRSTTEVSRVLAHCHREKIPVVTRGGGTGKAGGAVPLAEGIVLCTEQLVQGALIDRANLRACVPAGLTLATFQALVEEQRLFYPPDPSSANACTLGGNVATNAAGPACLKYGPTRDYVAGMTMVTASGEIVRVGRKTRKGVAGLDLSSLLVGSEGTLGVITELTLTLLPSPGRINAVWVGLQTVFEAIELAASVLQQGLLPRTMELLDETALKSLAGAKGLPTGNGAALLIEFDGLNVDEDPRLERLLELLDPSATAFVARDGKQRRLWRELRGQTSVTLKSLRGDKYSEDIVVPIAELAAVVRGIRQIGDTAGLETACYGHVGDGNLHINLLHSERPRKLILDTADRIFELVLSHGGSLTGEHGIGLLKQHMLLKEIGRTNAHLQSQIKSVFDPHNILNPGRGLVSAEQLDQ